jgi:hypothetical protein
MRFNNKFLRCKKGLESVTSIFLLLLMFTILTGLVVAYFNYNISVQDQMDIELERSKERIVLSKLRVDDQFRISNVVVNNTGTVEVEIRAIYEVVDGETILLFDPADYADSVIGISEALVIDFPAEPEVWFNPQAKLVVATERGIKSMEYEPILLYGQTTPPSEYDPTKLYVGPLMLKFDDFWYQKVTNNGDPNPKDPEWYPGWLVPKGSKNVAWNISVMNIDSRNITINRFASFTTVPNDSPSDVRTWFLEPAEQTTNTQFLEVNVTNTITFIWSSPKSLPGANEPDRAQSSYDTECTCMVFLTLFGVFHELDGTTTAYAQTIPFEAAVTVVAK